jgi:hypothetical protein
LPRLLLENPLHDAGADSKFPADLEDAIATCPEVQYSRLHRRLYPAPAEFGAVRPSAGETGIDPLSNNPPFKLGKYAQHLKHGFPAVVEVASPCWCRNRPTTLFMKALENAEQVEAIDAARSLTAF